MGSDGTRAPAVPTGLPLAAQTGFLATLLGLVTEEEGRCKRVESQYTHH